MNEVKRKKVRLAEREKRERESKREIKRKER